MPYANWKGCTMHSYIPAYKLLRAIFWNAKACFLLRKARHLYVKIMLRKANSMFFAFQKNRTEAEALLRAVFCETYSCCFLWLCFLLFIAIAVRTWFHWNLRAIIQLPWISYYFLLECIRGYADFNVWYTRSFVRISLGNTPPIYSAFRNSALKVKKKRFLL